MKDKQINVRVHYPQTEEGIKCFKKQLARIHAQLIVDWIMAQDFGDEEKRSLLDRAINGPNK